jgi:hypothetical protein
MRAYMVCANNLPSEGAVLVLAHTAVQAKRMAGPTILGWGLCDSWVELTVRWLRDADTLYLTQRYGGGPVLVDRPEICSSCHEWDAQQMLDSRCSSCNDEMLLAQEERRIHHLPLTNDPLYNSGGYRQ